MATNQRASGGGMAKTCPKCRAELWDDGSCLPCDWRRVPGQPARYSGDQPSDQRSSWLDDWWRPFLWIILTPIVTVPVSAVIFSALIRQPPEAGFPPNNPQSQIDLFQGGSCDSFLSTPCYEYAEVGPTLLAFFLPGLLNLAPIAWVLSTSIRVKAAALMALALGGIRSAIPILVLTLGYERVTNVAGTSYFRWDTLDFILPSEPTFGIWLLGALAWFGTVLIWAGCGLVVNRGSRRLPWLIGIVGGMVLIGLVGSDRGVLAALVLLLVVVAGIVALIFKSVGTSPGGRGHGA